MPGGQENRGLRQLTALTTRGRSFLCCGGACLVGGTLFGERDLLRLGVFLMALPLLAVAALYRTRYRMSCTRRLDPDRLPTGRTTAVTLRLENLSRLPTGLLLLQDRLPDRFDNPPRFVLDRVAPMGVREVTYTLQCDARGRFPIGPLSIRLADPFGLAELTRAFHAVDALIVTPQVVALPRVVLGGEWAGSGESRARAVASAGEQDVAPREYREGDDLRRVHWRSTARYGELMVRREEQPWQARACVVLDTRLDAHRGEGLDSSFEWAVSAAASVSVALARGGYALRFLDGGGTEIAGGGEVEGRLLDGLAEVECGPDVALGSGLERVRRGGEGLVVAVLGRLSVAEAAAVARVRTGGAVSVAVLLDTASWAPAGQPGAEYRPSPDYDAGAALLHAAGWRVIPVSRGTEVSEVWPLAGAGVRRHASGLVTGDPALAGSGGRR